jgi:hypothetical protein
MERNIFNNRTRTFNQRQLDKELSNWGKGLVLDSENSQQSFEVLENAVDFGTGVRGRIGTNIYAIADFMLNNTEIKTYYSSDFPLDKSTFIINTYIDINYNGQDDALAKAKRNYIFSDKYLFQPLAYDRYLYYLEDNSEISFLYDGSCAVPVYKMYRPLFIKDETDTFIKQNFILEKIGNVCTLQETQGNPLPEEHLFDVDIEDLYVCFNIGYYDTVTGVITWSIKSAKILKVIDETKFLINDSDIPDGQYASCTIRVNIISSVYNPALSCLYMLTTDGFYYGLIPDMMWERIEIIDFTDFALTDSELVLVGKDVFLYNENGMFLVVNENNIPVSLKKINDSQEYGLSDKTQLKEKVFSFKDNDQDDYDFILAGFSDTDANGINLEDGGRIIE